MISSQESEFGIFLGVERIADKRKMIENSYKICDTKSYSQVVRYDININTVQKRSTCIFIAGDF